MSVLLFKFILLENETFHKNNGVNVRIEWSVQISSSQKIIPQKWASQKLTQNTVAKLRVENADKKAHLLEIPKTALHFWCVFLENISWCLVDVGYIGMKKLRVAILFKIHSVYLRMVEELGQGGKCWQFSFVFVELEVLTLITSFQIFWEYKMNLKSIVLDLCILIHNSRPLKKWQLHVKFKKYQKKFLKALWIKSNL